MIGVICDLHIFNVLLQVCEKEIYDKLKLEQLDTSIFLTYWFVC